MVLPTSDSSLTEEVEEYEFYCYHPASFGNDRDNCPACEEMANTGSDSDDVCQEAHEAFDEEAHDATQGISVYSRQKFTAYLKPSTYRRLTGPENVETDVLYALVQVEGGDIPFEFELDTLSDDEVVQDASDDMYVVRKRDGSEVDAWSYFRENGVHLCFSGSEMTQFSEWHDPSRHAI